MYFENKVDFLNKEVRVVQLQDEVLVQKCGYSFNISNTVMSVITYIYVVFVKICNFAFFFSFIGLLIIKNGPSLQMITQILKNNHPPAIYKYIGGHIFV